MTTTKTPITAPAIAATGVFFPPDVGDVSAECVGVEVPDDDDAVDEVMTVKPGVVNNGVSSMVANSNLSNMNSVFPFAFDPSLVTTISWYVSLRSGDA